MAGVEHEDNAFEQAAKGPLPNGLQIFALEFKLTHKGAVVRTKAYRDLDREVESVCNAYYEILGTLGYSTTIMAGQNSIFGSSDAVRVRLDIIAAPAVINKWLLDTDGNLLRESPISVLLYAAKFKPVVRILGSLAHRFSEENDEPDKLSFKFVDPDGLKTGTDFRQGDFEHWIELAQATDKDFERIEDVALACDGKVMPMLEAIYRRACELDEYAPQSFLVPGLIPRGALTLMLGNKKVGKSAIALELLVAVARREKEWLGFPIDASAPGFAVYLFGEDSHGEVANRAALMSGGETSWLLRTIPDNGVDIDSVLAALTEKVAVLVVDPARKFFRGDEDGSDAVSDFFTKLETFAKAKNCAVIVLHHLKRNATPRTLAEVAMQYRGSSVFLDRPRVTLAVLRTKNETQFGIPAPDGVPLHNFLASTMFAGVRRLRRDEASFRHVNLDARSATEPSTATGTNDVLEATRRLVGAGTRVTRTGKAGLYELKPAELAGMPRVAVRAAVDALVADGRLKDASGILTIPVPAKHDAAVGDLA